jgi:hypothetical protein
VFYRRKQREQSRMIERLKLSQTAKTEEIGEYLGKLEMTKMDRLSIAQPGSFRRGFLLNSRRQPIRSLAILLSWSVE